MEINKTYNNYGSSYTNSANDRKMATEEKSTAKEVTEAAGGAKKTAEDELAYLSRKYSNYTFVAANYTRGMQYGSSSTVNVAISPQFLSKMASDPELEKEYEKNIAAMQECDEQFKQMQAARGWRVEAQGWAIDKDGGISAWTIVTKDSGAKSHLEKMEENNEKIREKNAEKKKKQKEMEEKRQADREEKAELKEEIREAGKEQIGDKFKDVMVIEKDDENMVTSKEKDKDEAIVASVKLDIKA